MKTRLLLCVMLGFGLVCVLLAVLNPAAIEEAAAAPTITRCVNPGGTGGCYASIQAAIDDSVEHDVITVATGTYYEHIYVDKNLELHGLGWGSTIIHGGYTGPTSTVKIDSGIDASTIISGFQITGGGTGITSTSTQHGGGIYMSYASPRIINTWVYSCTAYEGGGVFVLAGSPTFENVPVWNSRVQQYGGGYYVHGEANVTIVGNPIVGTNGTIWFNRAPYGGGGIFINGSEATIIGLRIWYNVAEMYGGGVYIQNADQPVRLFGNQIWWNGAQTIGYAGGGIYALYATNLDIFLNQIFYNISIGTGGGILLNQSGGKVHWNQINNNRVSGQSASSAGAHIVGATEADLTIDHNWFNGNISTNTGGGLGISNDAAPLVDSNVIVSNTIGSGTGAGIYLQQTGQAHLVNNIIARNVITDYGNSGSGISIFNSPAHFINNTVADNFNGGVYLVNAENAVVVNNIVAENLNCGLEKSDWTAYTLTMDYNDLFNNGTDYCFVTAATHDVDIWPRFLETGDMFNYYHVWDFSDVANRGDPSWAPLYDIDGLFRGYQVWLGADEHGEQYNLYAPIILR